MKIKATLYPFQSSYEVTVYLEDMGISEDEWNTMSQEDKEDALTLATAEDAENNVSWAVESFQIIKINIKS